MQLIDCDGTIKREKTITETIHIKNKVQPEIDFVKDGSLNGQEEETRKRKSPRRKILSCSNLLLKN